MQIDRAAHIIIVFWALVVITEKNQKRDKSEKKIPHSVKIISDTINHPRLEYHELKPECIRKEVYQARISASSASRWKTMIAELALASQEKGKTYLNAQALLEQTGEPFVKALEKCLTALNESEKNRQEIDSAETWFITNLDGKKIDFDPNTLEFFHIWVCWKVRKLYGETN
jgi:hypothetical protein